jgi:hypothetical protein
MQFEFLPAGAAECPLVRLFAFTDAEAESLALAIGDLSMGLRERVEMNELPGVVAVGQCRLTLVRSAWDQNLVQSGPLALEVRLTAGTWDNVAGLMRPIAEGSQGFQWLAGGLLISRDGKW